MLKRLGELKGWSVVTRSGDELGRVADSYFDDEQWTVRYVVVNTGSWLSQRPVLISPMAIDALDPADGRIAVRLSPEEVRGAPSADLHRPISRQYETAYAGYFAYPAYWAGPGVWGAAATPVMLRQAEYALPTPQPEDEASHLRSVSEVSGYHIEALDGEIGHIEEFLADDESWTIRYFIVDTSNWIGGRTVLVSPAWTRGIAWAQQILQLDLRREEIKTSPEYHPSMEIDGDYEQRLHAHYGRAPQKVQW